MGRCWPVPWHHLHAGPTGFCILAPLATEPGSAHQEPLGVSGNTKAGVTRADRVLPVPAGLTCSGRAVHSCSPGAWQSTYPCE